MIHHDGLMAVATVYPIAILLLAVEVRAMEPFLASTRGARVQLILGGIVSLVVVLISVSAVAECVRLLLIDGEATAYSATLIVLGGAGLSILVPITLVLLMFDRLGIWDAVASRNAAKIENGTARERLAFFIAIERNNPRSPRLSPENRARLEEEARAEEEAEQKAREREARKYGDSDIDPKDNV